VTLRNGLVEWKERWTNTGNKTRGVPFRHRYFLRQGTTEFRLGGTTEAFSLAGSPSNPTLFLEAAGGAGFGVTAESDWLRLLMALRARSGIGELYTDTLALAPKCSLDCELSLAPVREGGYWTFINALRRRWGVSGVTQERPVFWGYARAAGPGTESQLLARSLGQLGPIYVVLGPWQRLQPDTAVITTGQYPRLSADAPRAPGACPDFDVDAFLTFAHRERPGRRSSTRSRRSAKRPRRRASCRCSTRRWNRLQALQERWPFAFEGIRTADGKVFEDDGYSKIWLGT